jgi:hypothetical protein
MVAVMPQKTLGIERSLQWYRNLLLDFLRCETRNLGCDLRGDRAEKRISIDRKLRPGIYAVNARKNRDQNCDKRFLKQSATIQSIIEPTPPLTTTRSPAFKPLLITASSP